MVIGSSGLTADDYTALDHVARNTGVGVVAAGNFSVMAAICNEPPPLLPLIWTSGRSSTTPALESLTYQAAPPESLPTPWQRSVRRKWGCRSRTWPVLASARGGGCRHPNPLGAVAEFVVSTEIVFGGAGERLIMRHDPGESPEPYVRGTLLAIRKVAEVLGVRRGLDTLLFGPRSESHG